MNTWVWAALLVAGCMFSVYVTARFLVSRAGVLSRIDTPDERRLHTQPTPRGGGIGIPVAVSIAAAAVSYTVDGATRGDLLWWVLGFALPNGLLGAIDDWRPLRSRVKFAIQIGIAVAFVFAGYCVNAVVVPPLAALPLGWFSPVFTVAVLVWITNVFNFMDGMDALAAISGILFLIGLGTLGLCAGGPTALGFALTCAACAGGLIGFLFLNRPPAQIFMGDGGALFVGALLAGGVVQLSGSRGPGVPLGAAILVMATFVWDATYTIVFRIVHGEDWLHPHRRHLFQRLALAGWDHDRVRRVYIVGAGLCVPAAIVAAFGHPAAKAAAVCIALLGCVALVVLVSRVERRRMAPSHPTTAASVKKPRTET